MTACILGDAIAGVMDLRLVVEQRRLQRRLLEVHRAQPRLVLGRPRGRLLRRMTAMPQQEMAQVLPRATLVLLGALSSAHQVAQRLVLRIGHPHRRQVAAAVAPRELLGIASIGLHAVAALHGHQCRGDHVAPHAQLGELPVQHVAARPGLVAARERLGRAELLHRLAHRLRRVRNRPERAHLAVAAPLGHRDRDRLRVHIEPDVSGRLRHDQLLRSVALRYG
jgi:hypothetical protein